MRSEILRGLSRVLPGTSPRKASIAFILTMFYLIAFEGHAASVRGIVTDTSGGKVSGATVALLSGGAIVGSAQSHADGNFEILTGLSGRFFLVTSAKGYRQLETPAFY